MDLTTITELSRPTDRATLPFPGPADAVLAGGTWLFSTPQPHLRRLIDLGGLGWSELAVGRKGLHLGATCTLADLAGAILPPDWTAGTLLRQCCEALQGSFKICNAATVGGNLCMALPAGPIIALAVALKGSCLVWRADGSQRVIPAHEFVLDEQCNALAPGEILRALDIPAASLRRDAAFRRISLSAQGRSAALLIGTRGTQDMDITITAATRRPVQIRFAEVPSSAQLRQALRAAMPDALLFEDVHGAPEWRRAMTERLAEEIRVALAEPPPR